MCTPVLLMGHSLKAADQALPQAAGKLGGRKPNQRATIAPHCVPQTQMLESATENSQLGALSLKSKFRKLMAYLGYRPHLKNKAGAGNSCANALGPE